MEGYAGRCLPQLAGVLTGVAIGYALTRRRNLGMLGQPLSLLLILLVEMWGKLDVTDEGLAYRAPFSDRTLAWPEVRAIFREGRPGRRSFLLVGEQCAIHIPAHLASDFELTKKVLYSLPDPILCVNFNETTFRGFKVREKAKEKAPSQLADLLPAPVSAVRSPGSAGRDTAYVLPTNLLSDFSGLRSQRLQPRREPRGRR